MTAVTAWKFTGDDGNLLAGDRWGELPAQAILFHGGGQTRHAWGQTARRFAEAGLPALNVDLRGHGDSEWERSGFYAFTDSARDVTKIIAGQGTPVVLVGASLGGVVSLVASRHAPELIKAIILVDVTPTMQYTGIDRILNFMRARPDGFADLDDARAAITAYQPHRTRQASEEGMRRNLRRRDDGRWVWHWDPRTLTFATRDWLEKQRREMEAAVAALTVPVVLVRGAESDVVSEQDAGAFLALNPRARRLDVPGARHMVAGDENDLFCSAMLAELSRLGLLPPRAVTSGGGRATTENTEKGHHGADLPR
jgi:pimeloyl-ACP methyl ester carboxylesterase